MKLEEWAASIDGKGKRHYMYGYENDPEEFELDEGERIIARAEWIAEDYIAVFSEICEDHNAYKMARHIEDDLMNALKIANIDCTVSGPGTIFAKHFVSNYIKSAGWDY